MHDQKGTGNKKPRCVLATYNRRAMEGIMEAPSIGDALLVPMEQLTRMVCRDFLPPIFRGGEQVWDNVARAGSAMIELAKRPTV